MSKNGQFIQSNSTVVPGAVDNGKKDNHQSTENYSTVFKLQRHSPVPQIIIIKLKTDKLASIANTDRYSELYPRSVRKTAKV